MSNYRNMRIIVLFDLPMDTKSERDSYTRFRKFLLSDGYTMIQYSVYSRFCQNFFDVEKHIKRVKASYINNGNIRILTITEQQYEKMILLVGEKVEEEDLINADSLITIE